HHQRSHYGFAGSAGVFSARISLKCATHAAAAKRTSSFASSKAVAIAETSERSPRCEIASSAAARTDQFLSVVAFTSAFPVPGFGSRASCFAAAARTGEESSFLTVLNASYPIPAYGINRSEEHTSELQSRGHIVCRLLLEK